MPTFPGIASQDNCKKSVKSKPTNHSSDLLCLLDCPLGYVLKLFFFTCFQDNMKLANEGPVLSASTYGHLLALLPAQARPSRNISSDLTFSRQVYFFQKKAVLPLISLHLDCLLRGGDTQQMQNYDTCGLHVSGGVLEALLGFPQPDPQYLL